ncbi:Bowman-Birk type trypsin inhibitor-like [Oryza brachyantha]|uniref:Bowman-Birk serine protease inhibitors family domain-containing protein n=1 Tax=Oryza brachyantha TaxID=4533 RepID=J3KW15_ORYBR|nr:Bowman-Birk type trypsin inhibitor-like [Oryza brachyantha]
MVMKRCSLVALSLLGALLLAGISAAVAAEDDDDNILLPTDVLVVEGEGEESINDNGRRPWECCDNVERSPVRIQPPRFRCNDFVDRCAAACQQCDPVPSPIPRRRFVCRDWYVGSNPGPRCSRKHCSGEDDDELTGSSEAAPSPGKRRPWECCDTAVCTRSRPPTCSCTDTVAKCGSGCVQCKQVSSRPSRFRCLDSYHGSPGPKCH